MKTLLIATSLVSVLSIGTAVAADLSKKIAAQPVAAPAMSFDAFISAGLGYGWGGYSSTAEDGAPTYDNHGLQAEVRGSFATMFAAPFGFQADAHYWTAWKTSETDYPGESMDIRPAHGTFAGHLFWRESPVGALGLIGQYTRDVTSMSFRGEAYSSVADHTWIGLEGQYFIGNTTLYGQVAYHHAGAEFMRADFDRNGVTIAGQIRHFLKPDWMIALKGAADFSSATSSRSSTGDHDLTAWTVGARTEYRLSTMPLSLYAEVAYRDTRSSYTVGTMKENDTRVMVGATYSFGETRTLFDRDRAGASFDPLPVLGPLFEVSTEK